MSRADQERQPEHGDSRRSQMRWEDAQRIHDAALRYLCLGWSVIPVRPRGKTPLVHWQEYQRRLPTDTEIEAWFRHWRFANVGIITGKISGLVVLDVDPRHGGDQSLAEWRQRYGDLPETVRATTGGGGRHVYFATPQRVLGNRAGVMPGIDLRAEGGLVVAPPSIHPSGRHYAWEVSHQPGEIALAPLPPWLLQILREGGEHSGHPLAYWRHLAESGVEEGRRNDTIASFAGHLLWHGVDPEVALPLLLAWNRTYCRPPLDDAEVTRVVRSIARLHERHEPRPGG